ncbi:MAG TPA: pitrilysin family protein [Kofleriaceae bacterium]|nr:pitrilysin family protein [Kofleriaceae bacterium]
MSRAMSRAMTLAIALVAGCGPRTGPAEPPPPPAPLDWSTSGIDWSTPPQPGPEPSYRPPMPSELTLPNGLKLVVVEEHRLPLVSASLIMERAGSAYDPPGKSGLAALTADLLDEGAGSLDSLALARELERLGASARTFAQADSAVLSIDMLASTSAEGLALLVAMAMRPSMTAADIDRVRADRVSTLRRRRDQPRAVATMVFDRVLFGSHPYAQPGAGYAETVAALTADDVRGFYQSHYGATGATLVVAGDITVEQLRAIIAPSLGAWAPQPAVITAVAPPVTTTRPPRLVVVDNPGATQTVLSVGRVSMTRTDPRFVTGDVANTILGGSFTSRLNRRLREQLGYTYGAGSSFWTGAAAGTWRVSTALQTPNTADGIREALALVESMRTADVAPEELTRSRTLQVRELPRNFDTNRSIVDTFAGLIADGLPLDYYQRFPEQVGTITAEQVRTFATEHWDADGFVMILVGDLKTILDGVRGYGQGSVLELDPDGNPVRIHTTR